MKAIIRLLDKIGAALYDLFVGPGVLEKELRLVSDRLAESVRYQKEQAAATRRLFEIAEKHLEIAIDAAALQARSSKALDGIADRIGQIGPHT